MAVYLLSWDPTRWDWRNIKEQADQVSRGAPVVRQWSCGSNRRIFNGDTVYFIRQGREPRGLFARGTVTRGSYEAANVDVQDANRGRNTLVVDVQFDALENAPNSVIIARGALKGGQLGKFLWDIRESGVKIPEPVAVELERVWATARGGAPASDVIEPPTGMDVETPAVEERKVVNGGKRSTGPREARLAVLQGGAAAEKPSNPPTQPRAEPPSTGDDEVARLQREREARLRKIKERELEQRKARAGDVPVPLAPAPLSREKRDEILVQNYFIMLDAELQGELYSKADHRNRILKELGDNDADAVDRAHRHISAVLAETGLPFADSFPPEGGFDDALEKAVHVFIEANPELVEALWIDQVPAASSIPVELDDAKAYWAPVPERGVFRPSGRPAWHPAGVNEIDYRVRESRNRNLSIVGERFVLAFERARLREAGLKDSIDQVAWQSQTFGDSFGYDIRSVEADGSERLICVKTTNYGPRFPFVLSNRELERARENLSKYFIYRIFRFSRGAKLFMLPASELAAEALEPVVYRSWI